MSALMSLTLVMMTVLVEESRATRRMVDVVGEGEVHAPLLQIFESTRILFCAVCSVSWARFSK